MLSVKEISKRLAGNASFYFDQDRHRSRLFLNRNLFQALDDHAQRLRHLESLVVESGQSGTVNGDHFLVDFDSRRFWKYPGDEVFNSLMEDEQPILKVEIKSLRLPEPRQAEDDHGQPRKRARLPRAACQVVLNIDAKDRASKKSQPAYRDRRSATMQVCQQANGEYHLDLDMGGPFVVNSDKLYVTVERGARWKKTLSPPYALHIRVEFASNEDAALILPYLSKTPDHLNNPRSSALGATWPKLPECPPTDGLLPVHRKDDGERLSLDHGLDVDISWSTPRSPLSAFAHAVRPPKEETRASLPSPAHEELKHGVRVVYDFTHQTPAKRLRLRGALCPFCRRRDYGTFEKLHLHLKNSHDLFKFDVKKTDTNLNGKMETVASVGVHLADPYPPKLGEDPFDNIAWVAPQRPFDISKYLEGDDTWVKGRASERRRNHARHAANMTQTTHILPVRASHSRLPEDIQDLSRQEREKHVVPSPPTGISFFRTVSKRMIKEGDMISESDDDIDDSWLKMKQNQGVTGLSQSSTAAQQAEIVFMQQFNDFAQEEQLSGDLSVGDTLVRFARHHSNGLLQRKRMRAAFRKKAEEFKNDKIITDAVFRYSLQILRNLKGAAPARPGSRKPSPQRSPEELFDEQLQSVLDELSWPGDKLVQFTRQNREYIAGSQERKNEIEKHADQLLNRGFISETVFQCVFVILSAGKDQASSSLESEVLEKERRDLEKFEERVNFTREVALGMSSRRDLASFILDIRDKNAQEEFRKIIERDALDDPGKKRPARWYLHRTPAQLNIALNKDVARLGLRQTTRDGFNRRLQEFTSALQDRRLLKPAPSAGDTIVKPNDDGEEEMLDEVIVQRGDAITNGAKSAARALDLGIDVTDLASQESPSESESGDAPSSPVKSWQSRCLCGTIVDDDDMRIVISCSNLDCAQPNYHMRCVGLSARTPDWTCHVCSPVTAEEEAPEG